MFNLQREGQSNVNLFVNILAIHDKFLPFQFLSLGMRMYSPIRTWGRNSRISVAEENGHI